MLYRITDIDIGVALLILTTPSYHPCQCFSYQIVSCLYFLQVRHIYHTYLCIKSFKTAMLLHLHW